MLQHMSSLNATPLSKLEEGYVEINSYSNKMEHLAILLAAQKHGCSEKILSLPMAISESGPESNRTRSGRNED